jgi:hypothetical protein
MVSLARLQAQLRPLVGAVVLDGDLLIFPSAEQALVDTSVDLYLSTTAGAFALDLFPDGQTPRVAVGQEAQLDLPRQAAGLAGRRPVWARLIAELNAGRPVPLVHERFALAGCAALRGVLGARVEQVWVYAFADDGAPTGLKLVFPDLVVHLVPGAGGTALRTGAAGDWFAAPVREHPV